VGSFHVCTVNHHRPGPVKPGPEITRTMISGNHWPGWSPRVSPSVPSSGTAEGAVGEGPSAWDGTTPVGAAGTSLTSGPGLDLCPAELLRKAEEILSFLQCGLEEDKISSALRNNSRPRYGPCAAK